MVITYDWSNCYLQRALAGLVEAALDQPAPTRRLHADLDTILKIVEHPLILAEEE